MQRKALLILYVSILLSALLIIPSGIMKAQSDTCYSRLGSYGTTDITLLDPGTFGGGSLDYTMPSFSGGTIIGGLWNGPWIAPPVYRDDPAVYFQFIPPASSGFVITRITASVQSNTTFTDGGGYPSPNYILIDDASVASHGIADGYMGEDDFTLDTGTIEISSWSTVKVFASVRSRSDDTGAATVIAFSLCGHIGAPDTAWAYPLAAGDRARVEDVIAPFNALTTPGTTDSNSTIFLSPRLGDSVHAAVGGSVLGVELLRPDCFNTNDLSDPDARGLWPPDSCINKTGESNHDFPEGYKFLSAVNTYVVTVSTSGIGYLYYLVSSPTVQAGQSVSKGCIIGKTAALYVENFDILSHLELSTYGWTIVEAVDGTGAPFDVIPYLTQEPQNLICGQSQRSSTCKLVTNPTFANNAESWTLESDGLGVSPINPPGTSKGLSLVGGQARQSLSLEETTSYSIQVTWHEDAQSETAADFTVQLGADDPRLVLSEGSAEQTFETTPTTFTPNAPNLFDLIVISGHGSIIVDSICVFDPSDTTKPPPPGGCLLYNSEFDQLGYWLVDDNSDFADGVATMSDTGTLEQTTHLYPKTSGPQNYTITVRARRAGVPVSGQSIDLLWHINSDSNTTLGTFSDHNWKDATDTFEITADEDVTVHLEASGSDSQVLELDSVCITTTDGDSPPGYGSRDPLSASCKACIYEVTGDLTTDVPELVQWLGCRMNQIWYCQAKTILYGIWQALISILTFLGFLRLWMAGTIMAGAGWTNSNLVQVAGWLNGQFINLTTAITNVFSSGGHVTITNNEGNTNFWDALVALFNGANGIVSSISTTLDHFIAALRDVILTAIDRTWQLILLIIGIVLLIINIIVTVVLAFLNFVLTLINVLFTIIFAGINTPAVVPTGMPTCDTGASTIPESCVPIFMLDHSWFADNSPVNLLVTLIEGSVAFSLFVWAIYRIRGAFTEAS